MAPGLVWTGVDNLASTGIRSPDRPSRSESLHRLSYPRLHSKGVPFELRPTYCLSRVAVFVKSLKKKKVGIFPRLDKGLLLPHPLQFIIHQSSHHSDLLAASLNKPQVKNEGTDILKPGVNRMRRVGSSSVFCF